MRTLRIALATGAVVMTMAQLAAAAGPATTTSTTTTTTTAATPPLTSTTTTTTATTPPPTTGVTVTPTPVPLAPKPPKAHGQGKSNGSSGKKGNGSKNGRGRKAKGKRGRQQASSNTAGAVLSPSVSPLGSLSLGPSSCSGAAPPLYLMPIYQAASNAYGLGPQGPGVLAAINGIESGFGANLGPSSAGAVGWMQFLPSTWKIYGVDANGDGKADPNNPQDAIFAAARYLQAAGMPADTAGAIFSYNHASWYVAEVLANASCYSGGTGSFGSGLQQLTCTPAPHSGIPADYMLAFENAASRYDLGERGVWALAAVARLESNFGRDMTPEQLITEGPLALDRNEWNRFEVDGDGDGQILHADIQDAAATVAREIWSQGDLRAGLFLHNQADWYVQQVLQQANQLAGSCTTSTTDWTVSMPQTLSNPLPGWQRGRVDMGVDFSAPPGTPIYAPFDAVVVKTGAPGWPGGAGGVLLQPAHGQYVYIYESVQPVVQPGDSVHAGQQIGFAGPTSESTGIEIGFADAGGSPLAHSIYHEGDVTAWGLRMAQFLSQIGAP